MFITVIVWLRELWKRLRDWWDDDPPKPPFETDSEYDARQY
jgi:hypothetical protein